MAQVGLYASDTHTGEFSQGRNKSENTALTLSVQALTIIIYM